MAGLSVESLEGQLANQEVRGPACQSRGYRAGLSIKRLEGQLVNREVGELACQSRG